jgi:hypothetical protein
MYYRKRRSLYVASYLSPFAALFFLLHVFPAGAVAQMSTPSSRSAPPLQASDSEEFAPLTVPQQKARQLATILIGKRETPIAPTQKTPLRVIAEQAMRLGKRTIIPLFVLSHLEGRLVGGRQTFAFSLDRISSVAKEDARRPLFLPASQAIMALEVVAK